MVYERSCWYICIDDLTQNLSIYRPHSFLWLLHFSFLSVKWLNSSSFTFTVRMDSMIFSSLFSGSPYQFLYNNLWCKFNHYFYIHTSLIYVFIIEPLNYYIFCNYVQFIIIYIIDKYISHAYKCQIPVLYYYICMFLHGYIGREWFP